MFKGNMWKTLKHYLKTSKSYGRSIARLYLSNHIEETNGLLQKNIYRNKKKKKFKQQRGKWTSKEQEGNNKQQDNANPTTWEMNMIQMDCCKNIFIKTKKIGTQTKKNGKWTSREQENNDKKKFNTNPNKQHEKWTW